MASPIHKFLFSPPPSPPCETDTGADFAPLKALVTGLTARESGKPPTPRLGESDILPLSLPVPHMRAPSPLGRSSSPRRGHDVDIEAGEGVAKSFAQRTPILAKFRLVVQRFMPNLPRPVVRLFAFVAILFILASFVSSVILPAISPLPQPRAARPVAKKPQWTPKAYVPPQANAHPLVAREYRLGLIHVSGRKAKWAITGDLEMSPSRQRQRAITPSRSLLPALPCLQRSGDDD
ncbi:unnamed protein product [Cutaneotrichosporon oleaginosum]